MASGTIKKKSGGGGAYDFISSGAELVSTFTKTINLKNDTSFDSWTPTTTNTMIKGQSASNDFSLNCNTFDYDYCFLTFFDVDVAYLPGATLVKTPAKNVQCNIYAWFSYPNYSYILDNKPSVGGSSNTIIHYIKYYNGSGNITYESSSYGPMRIGTALTASFSNAGSVNTTCAIKIPPIYARCNSSFFDTSRKAEVDSANTNGVFTIEVYRIPKKKWAFSYSAFRARDMIVS